MHSRWALQGFGLAVGVAMSVATGCQSAQPATETTQPATETTQPAAATARTTAQAAQPYRDFGEPMQGDPRDAIAADTILASVPQYDGQNLRIRGQVQEVCQKRGCWLTLAGQEHQEPIFVKFTCPIDGRLIPTGAVGREVIVEGQLQHTQMSEAMARHLAEDAGASEQEIAAIEGPQPLLRVASPSARVLELPDEAAPQR